MEGWREEGGVRVRGEAALESKRSIWVEQSCFRYSVSLFGVPGWIHGAGEGGGVARGGGC